MAKKTETKNQNNIFVLDPEKGYGPEYIENPKGLRWEYHGQWLYLYKRQDGVLTPYEPTANMEAPPEELYRVLRGWWPLVRAVFAQSNRWLDKVQTGLWIGILVVLLFFVYLIFSSMGGA